MPRFIGSLLALALWSCSEAPFPSDAELALMRDLARSKLPPADPTNRYADDARAAVLGARLFIDPSFSVCGTVACASCHPSPVFTVSMPGMAGCNGMPRRSVPSLSGAAFSRWFYWDGRKDSLWSHAILPLTRSTEMGATTQRVIDRLEAQYASEYLALFGVRPALEADPDRVLANFGKAVAAYLRTVPHADSTFDQQLAEFLEAATADVAAGEEKRVKSLPSYLGMKTFVRKGRCISCHKGAQLADQGFHNLGLREAEPDLGRAEGIDLVKADPFNGRSKYSDDPQTGSIKLDRLANDLPDEGPDGAFKTATLRNVAHTAPYMHTGRFNSLAEVVDFYNLGGDPAGFSGQRAKTIIALELSGAEKAALVALLQAMDAP
jgi:cytochrome c peroxidase